MKKIFLVFLIVILSINFVSAQTPEVSLGTSSTEEGVVSIPIVQINPLPENIAVTTWINYTSVGDIPHNNLGGLQGGSSGEYYHLNSSIFSYLISNIYSWITTASSKKGDGIYLYNDTSTIFLNETKLNSTISDIAEVNTFEENINVGTSGGDGFNISTNLIDFQITQITVTPSSLTHPYRFEAYETTSGDIIDRNRIAHIGVWNIVKAHAINDTVTVNITNSVPDDTFTIKLTYLDNYT